MEQVFLALFPEVVPLQSYTRAESGVSGSASQKFDWTNREKPLFASGQDLVELMRLLPAMLQGVREINEHPDKYLIGPIGNRRFTHFFRVLFWMLLRTQYILDGDELVSYLTIFDTFASCDLANDCNVVEVLRSMLVIPVSDILLERMPGIIESIFARKSETCSLLKQWHFMAFIEGFRKSFRAEPRLFEMAIESHAFRFAFSELTKTCVSVTFSRFLKLVKRAKFNLSKLIDGNVDLESFLRWRAYDAIRFLKNSPDVTVSDELYTQMVLAVLRHTTLSETQRVCLEYVAELTTNHECLDLNGALGLLPEFVRVYIEGLPVALGKKYKVVRDVILEELRRNDFLSASEIRVFCDLADREERTEMINNIGLRSLNVVDLDANTLCPLAEIVKNEGIGGYESWAKPFFECMCLCDVLGKAGLMFVEAYAKHCDASELIEISVRMKEKFGFGTAFSEKFDDIFLNIRPELGDELRKCVDSD
jgi:hypothetical protein